MAVKSVSVRIEEEMLEKLAYVADYEGRSVNSQVLVLIRESIKAFEDENGVIDGNMDPAVNVKPARKSQDHQLNWWLAKPLKGANTDVAPIRGAEV